MSRDRNVVKQFFKSMSNELSGVEFFGYLGNREGVVKADNLNNVWVLLFNGSVVKARNKVAPLVSRTPVAVGYTKEDPKLLQVLRVMNVYDRNTQPYLPPHAKSHSWPGADTVSIRAEQIVPGLALPSGGMVVKYYGWPYEIDGAWYYIRSREFDLTSYIPDTGAVWVSVEVDDAGDVTYVESDPADSKDLLTFAMLPVVPETRVMLFAVKCYTGQTEVVKTELDNDIFDPRLALHARKAAAVWGEITGDIEDQTDLVEYIDDRMTGLWDDRGNYDASGNAYPSSGGSGTAGAILKGDIWTISVAGTLPTGRVVEVGDTVRALVDSPGSTEANWAIGQNNIGYVAENSANKTDTMAGNTASSTKYLSAKGVYDWAVSTFQAVSTALSQIAGLTPSDNDILQRKSGAWTNRTLAQLFADFISGSLTREKLTANRTYYVRTDGSDSNNGLTDSSGGAFLTIAKAISTCQSIDLAGYTVTIQIGSGTFSENLTVENINGSLNIQGALTELETITSATISAGSAGTRGTITKTGAFTGDSYAGKLAYFVTDGEYRVIRSHDNNAATVVGTCPSSTTQNVKIYGWGTTIAGGSGTALKINGQNSVSITDIQFTSSNTAGGVVPKLCLNLNFTRCNFDCILYAYYCNDGGLAYCVLDYTSTYMLRLSSSKFFNLYGSWLNTNGTACVDCNSHSHILIYYGTDIGGSTPTYGILVQMLSSAVFINSSGTGYARIANCGTGIRTINGAQVIGTTNNQYASNSTNESADSSTYAYID